MKLSKIIFIALTLTFIFNYDLIFNITKPIHFDDTDYPLHLLIIKNTINSTLSGDFSKILTLPIFYPVEGSIAFSDSFFIQTILYFPIFLISKSVIFTYNLLVILNSLLSFVGMYALVFYLTKRSTVSVLASAIFAFNPFIYARYPTAVEIHSLVWIPLIFLFLEKSLKIPSSRNIFLFFLFLSCQLLSTLYYSVFLSIFLPIYFFVRIIQEKSATKVGLVKFFNQGFLLGLAIFVFISIGLGLIYYNFYSKESIRRGIEAQLNYSVMPLEFLNSHSPRNFFYNYLNNLVGFPKNKSNFEHHVFLGWSILIFIVVGLFICFKKKILDRKLIFYLSMAFLSLVLAFGPKFLLFNLIHTIDPLVSFIRAPARFVVFFFFFASLSIGLIWIKLFNKENLKEKIIFLCFLFLVVLEYFNLPVKFQDIPEQTKQFYQYLDSREDIKVIVELPLGVGLRVLENREQIIYLDGQYLLFAATLHSKKLLNGYSGFIPQDYAQKLRLFNTGVLNKQKLEIVKNWGVDAIVLHKSNFKNTVDFKFTYQSLVALGIPEIKNNGELILFDLTAWNQN